MILKHTGILTFLFFFMLLLNLQFILCQPVQAGHLNAPMHHISMEFDLETNSLQANSRIELPAGASLQLDLSQLNVSRILVNGQLGEIPQDDYYLTILESREE